MQDEPARRQMRPRSERRRDLAEAALACLRRDGHAQLTARKVAAQAGVSLGHITYHFKDMQDLLAEAYHLASQELLEATLADLDRSGGTAEDRLRAFLWAGFTPRFLDRDYLRVRIDLWSAALAHPELEATERALYDRYRRRLEQLITALGASAASGARASDAIMAMLDGLWLDWLRRADRQAIENGLEACMAIARASVGHQPGGGGRPDGK